MIDSSIRLVISGLGLKGLHVGQGVYAYRIITGLLRQAPEYRFKILAPPDIPAPSDIPEDTIIRLPRGREIRHTLLYGIYWSNRILAQVKVLPQETVFHSPSPIVGLGRARRDAVTIHDCLYRSFPVYYGRSGVRRVYLNATERYAAGATRVFTQSAFSLRDIADKTAIPSQKMRILHPWVDRRFTLERDEEEVRALRQRLALPERFWLYIGGYDVRKNAEFLIRCYAEARRAKKMPPLVLAGDVPASGTMACCDVFGALKATRLGSDDVLMPGRIRVEDLPGLYRAAALTIYPSLMEGFGLPPAESMAVGTPVLVSDNSSLPEVVHRKECRFDASQPEELIAKLLAAAGCEEQFSAPLPVEFTERYGIKRYLQLIEETGGASLSSGT